MSKNAVIFVEGRAAFPAVFAPDDYEGTSRFGITVLCPKGGQSAKLIEATAESLIKASAVKRIGDDKRCYSDGDDYDYDGHAGCLVLKAYNVQRPHALDNNASPITEEDGVLYAGCWIKARVELYVSEKYKRLAAKLHGVQFIRNDEAFGGGGPPSAEGFEPVDNGTEDPPF